MKHYTVLLSVVFAFLIYLPFDAYASDGILWYHQISLGDWFWMQIKKETEPTN